MTDKLLFRLSEVGQHMEHIHRRSTLYASQLLHQFGYPREEVATALNADLEDVDRHIDANGPPPDHEATGDELFARCHEATLSRMALNERFYELVQLAHADGHTIDDIARAGNAHPGAIEDAIASPPRSLRNLNDAYFVALRAGHTPLEITEALRSGAQRFENVRRREPPT